MSEQRKCSQCQQVKPLVDFNKDKKGRGGYGYSCKPCAAARAKRNYHENKEERKDSHRRYAQRPEVKAASRDRMLRRKYGVTAKQYDRLLSKQGGVCAICKQDRRDTRQREMPVDHDHDSGKVRGILCDHCNRVIGLFGDSPDVIARAIKYLKEWG